MVERGDHVNTGPARAVDKVSPRTSIEGVIFQVPSVAVRWLMREPSDKRRLGGATPLAAEREPTFRHPRLRLDAHAGGSQLRHSRLVDLLVVHERPRCIKARTVVEGNDSVHDAHICHILEHEHGGDLLPWVADLCKRQRAGSGSES